MKSSGNTLPDVVFGPVPSRRLGRSLGLNNIPPKICSYSCVYCQVGRTSRLQTKREMFYGTEELFRTVETRYTDLKSQAEPVDYFTFVPDGEPILDINLGIHIRNLKKLDIPVAVISNGSLLSEESVRNDLYNADWCSVKVDTVDNACWHQINRPRGGLSFSVFLEGIRQFSKEYPGVLVTETMLIKGLNDSLYDFKKTAEFLAVLNPKTAYISVPIRPPAESWVQPPSLERVNAAFQIFSEMLSSVEFLIAYEGDEFFSHGNVEQELLNITSVHPMRRSAVERLIREADRDWTVVTELLRQHKLVEVDYEDERYYIRNLRM